VPPAKSSHGARRLTKPTYDQSFWEQLWSKTLREHVDKVAQRHPNAHLVREIADLHLGRALDGAATAAAGQIQVSVEPAVAAFDPLRWEIIVAEERARLVAGSGVDAVIRARRLS